MSVNCDEPDGATIPAFEVIRFLVFREAKAVGTHARHQVKGAEWKERASRRWFHSSFAVCQEVYFPNLRCFFGEFP